MKAKRKEATVDVIQWTGDQQSIEDFCPEIIQEMRKGPSPKHSIHFPETGQVIIQTPFGAFVVDKRDWLVRDENNVYGMYPADYFEKSYLAYTKTEG